MAVIRGLNRRMFLIAGLGGLVVLFFILRGQDLSTKTTESGDDFLERVMTASGGKENYDSLKKLSFIKDFKLYDKDGAVEIDRKELHSYNFTTGTDRLIQWKEDSITYNLIEKDTSLFQTVNKIIDTSMKRSQLQNKLNAATFVIGLPYTLDTDASSKVYNGIKKFENVSAHELEVTFQNSDDIWRLYYNLETLEWLGYWVQTSDHYSLVVNEEMTMINGFKFPRKRKSYRTDEQKNRLYLRADYEYSGYYVD